MNASVSFDMVRQVVAVERRHGSKLDTAIADAASWLGFSPRWVRSVIRDEPAAIKPRHAAGLHARFKAWLAADIARTEALIIERRKMLAVMEGRHVAATDEVVAGQGDLFVAWDSSLVAGVKR